MSRDRRSADEMDITGACYGLRYSEGGSPKGLIHFYTEDDETYYEGWNTLNYVYIPNIIKMLEKAYKAFPLEPKETEDE